MPINPFKLERYFAKYEFSVKYLLSSSDCESLTMAELLEMASPESRELWNTLKLSYTESPGHPLLREEVARLYTGISPENVLIAVPEEAIYIAMQTLLAPGDHVIVLSPAYQSLSEIAVSLGCQVTPWRLEPASEGWKLDLAQLEQALTTQTRLLVLNFPNNPTGYLPSRQEFDAILEVARQHHLTVFSDEMYRRLEADPARRLPSVAEVYENGVALSGLSKSFALPGLRLGWLTTQNRAWIENWLAFKDYTTICNSAPGEILGIIALQNTDRIVQRNLEIIGRNLTLAREFCGKHSDKIAWISPNAGSIAFPRWLGPGPVEQFCQEVLAEQGVMIVPGSLFDFPDGHFRLGLGRKNFGEALEHLDEYFGAHRAG
jgi:aspartate/methionine/tyrosine aminotransferase